MMIPGMSRRGFVIVLALAAIAGSGCEREAPTVTADGQIDLLLTNAAIWSDGAERPRAGWVAISEDRILEVGEGPKAPEARHTIDLEGRLVVPGFNDSHVHFASAGALLLGVNLLDVSAEEPFRQRIAEAAERLPKGSWITGGDWGAYEAWAVGSDGSARGATTFAPTRALIDGITPEHPVLVTRFDHKMGLANATALTALGIASTTGVLEGDALAKAIEKIPESSFERRLAEARRAFLECRRWGVTSVQDMSPLDQVAVYKRLRGDGELTARVHFSPARLSDVGIMIDKGWTIGAGDAWIRFGTVKSHIDGIMGNRTARFFAPYADNAPEMSGWRGGWREFSEDLGAFEHMLTQADAAGIQLRVHAIGDEANALLLDMIERIGKANGAKDRRFRLVHAQVIAPGDFPRMKGLGIVAEVQPYHCTDDMRWMEERIGPDRSRGAYAFRSLMEAGATLSFGSDWPGTNASYYPVNPILGLYAAVTRQTVKGTPAEGWFPEQRLALHEALAAYTRGGAYASFEESSKGTIAAGMLADLAVLDTNLFETPPSAWLDAKVDYTIAGGQVVYDRAAEASAPAE